MICWSVVSKTTAKTLTTAAYLASSTAALSSLSFTLRDPTLLPVRTAAAEGSSRVKTFPVFNPAKGKDEVIATVECMGKEEVTRAIDAASKALPSWRDETTGAYRGSILQKWSDLLHQNAEDLATIMTMESGKPLSESRGEVSYAASFLSYYASEAVRPTSAGGGVIIPTPFVRPSSTASPRGTLLAVKEAIGVAALVTPWNFPLAMITRKVGPALAVGCTVVVKPSELTPLSALAVSVLGERAGVPPGVFELVTADRESTPAVGTEMCTNPAVKKISFTGSTAVGKLLMKMSSDSVKRLSLELGGNAPFLVFADADLDTAVTALMASKFRNAGQTCVCSDRFLIHEDVYHDFLLRLLAAVDELRVGPGMDASTTVGPLITSVAAEGVVDKIEEAVREGAELVRGGGRMSDVGDNFVEPTVVANVSVESRLWKEETFGPVVAMRTFATEEEALVLANDSNVGLASYFCGRDLRQVMRVTKRLETGLVGVNLGIISTATAPFGGVKESGLGREGSAAGIDEYLETKYVCLDA